MNLSRQLLTGPTEYIITDAEMELHAKALGESTEDYALYVRAAEEWAETITARKFLTQTWKLFLDNWPCSDRIPIPFGQLQSVASIKYTPSSGAQVTFASTNWEISTSREPGLVSLSYQKIWPITPLKVLDPIEIEFTCGWLTPADVPKQIKNAVLLVAGHLYEHREEVMVGDSASINSKLLEMGAGALLVNWRLHV
jgi:uncharacterized phiE125 gp8 family phage protein